MVESITSSRAILTSIFGAGDAGNTPSTDQRGEPRVVEIIDMGAYEVQTLVPKFTG